MEKMIAQILIEPIFDFGWGFLNIGKEGIRFGVDFFYGDTEILPSTCFNTEGFKDTIEPYSEDGEVTYCTRTISVPWKDIPKALIRLVKAHLHIRKFHLNPIEAYPY